MNIRYISNIFRGENLWNFWCVCPEIYTFSLAVLAKFTLSPIPYCSA